jgi:transcriptional regulator GlxA family with amidase domain
VTHRVGILVHDNITMIDVAGPADVFHHANAHGAAYETMLISPDGGDVTASNGLRLSASHAAGNAPKLDTVIIPGAYGMVTRPFGQPLTDAVTALTRDAARIASVCTGSFLLAQIGLLDHRRATTHWTHAARFRKVFPLVDVQPDALFVRDGNIITAAGISSGVDLALSLVEDDYGPDVARAVTRQMVVFMQRPGGLAQCSVRSKDSVAPRNPLRPLLDAIAADPAADYPLARMASLAGVSTRTLARLFRDQVGTTPAQYVESTRVESAKALLRAGHTVSSAAVRSGFGSAETLRRVFAARVGVSPSAYAAAAP